MTKAALHFMTGLDSQLELYSTWTIEGSSRHDWWRKGAWLFLLKKTPKQLLRRLPKRCLWLVEIVRSLISIKIWIKSQVRYQTKCDEFKTCNKVFPIYSFKILGCGLHREVYGINNRYYGIVRLINCELTLQTREIWIFYNRIALEFFRNAGWYNKRNDFVFDPGCRAGSM